MDVWGQSQDLMPSAKPRINVVLEPGLKAKFERICYLERRSMSNKLLTMIEEVVAEAEKEGIFEGAQKGTSNDE